jgi:drug/metabolite transporter (DMT)-like permease
VPRSSAFAGIAMMVLSSLSFSVNDVLIKMAMQQVPPFEALFMRGIGSLVLGVPLLAALGYLDFAPKMLDPRVQVRNLLEVLAAMGAVVGLAHAPIADFTALNQTSPLLLVIGASWFFRERLRGVQIGFILLAFAGALCVAQPGAHGFSPFTLFGLWSAVCVATRDLFGRTIHLAIPGLVIAVGAGLVEIVGAGAGGLVAEHWIVPPVSAMLLCLATSAFLIMAHWLLLLAYRRASVGTIAPFTYLSTIWALVAGGVVFGTVPNALAFAGIGLIVVGGVAVMLLERWSRDAIVAPE